MMNILALSLVLTSILASGILSPTPNSDTQNRGDNGDHVIVKEGHRVVVVEYEQKEGDGNTKVLISSQDGHIPLEESSSKENLKEGSVFSSCPRELVCDAFGKCKHKLASVLDKSKEKVAETAQKASDKIHNVNEEARDSVAESVSKVKDTVTDKAGEAAHVVSDKVYDVKETVTEKAKDAAHKVSGKVYDVKEEAKDTVYKAKDAAHKVSGEVYDVKEEAKDTVGKVKERVTDKAKDAAHKVSDKVSDMKEEVKDAAGKTPGKAKFAAKDTVDTAKSIGVDIERNLTDIIEPITEKAKMAEQKAKERVHKTEEEGVNKIFRQGRVVLDYLVGMKEAALAVAHLLGFSVAYGMCVWVTFASSYVLARTVPREQFGVVQSKIYGVYFTAMAYSVGLALAAYLLSQRGRLWSSGVVMFQGWNLLASLLMVLVNLLYLEPRATKVIFERMKLEKEEGRGGGLDDFNIAKPSSRGVTRSAVDREPLKETDTREEAEVKSRIGRMGDRLKKMNTYSSVLNLATLMSLSCHLVHLAQTLIQVAH